MDCVSIPKGNEILSCYQEDARLWIGTTTTDGVKALFTDIATGRKTILIPTEDNDEWYVTDPPLIPGHTYEVQLVVKELTPVSFYPYVLNGTDYEAYDTACLGVTFPVTKCYDYMSATYTGSDQWVSI